MERAGVEYFDPDRITNPARALYLLVEQYEDATRRYMTFDGTQAAKLYIERYERRAQRGGIHAHRTLYQSGETTNYLSRTELYLVEPSVAAWLVDVGYVERMTEHAERHLCPVNGCYVVSARGIQYIPKLE